MKSKVVTKVMSYVLTAAMVVGGFGLSPLATVEVRADAPTVKDINLNVSGNIAGISNPTSTDGTATKWEGSKIYMGNKLWRVLDSEESSSGLDGHAFLFSEDILDHKPYHDSKEDITWQDCTLRRFLNGADNLGGDGTLLGDIFTTNEVNAIPALLIENPDRIFNGATYDGGNDTEDKLFLLSYPEVCNCEYGFGSNKCRADKDGLELSNDWTLRSPGSNSGGTDSISITGDCMNYLGNLLINDISVRPAFHLNLSSILFSSASGASKSTFASISENYVSDNAWKLTLIDADDTSFTAALPNTAIAGKTVTVSVNTAGSGSVSYNQTSAMLVDSNETVVAYGSIGDAAVGEKSFQIPDSIALGTYQLKVFPEQVNSGNQTDYAGQVVEQQINVVTVSSVTVSPNAVSVNKGKSQPFTATVSGDNSPSQSVAWTVDGKTSDNTSISDNGLLTIALDETAAQLTVTATSTADPDKEGTAVITVLEPDPIEPPYVYDEGICVVKQKVDVSKRFATTEKIKRYRVKPSKYASVNSKGVVSAKKEGEVTIRAYKKVGKKYEPVGGEVKLKIEKPKLTKITATKVGQKAELLDHLKNSTNRPTRWKMSKTKAAILDETTGEVTAVKNGTATITAYFGEGKNAAKYTTRVTVKIPRLSASKVKLRVGKSRKLKVMNATVKPTAWKSSNPSVATVDTKGKVKAAAVGEATISATVDGVDYSCTVTVKK